MIEREPVAPLDFCPVLVCSIELAQPLAPIAAPPSESGLPYESVFVLARLKGEPVGLATLSLPADGLSTEELAVGLWDAVEDRLRARARPAGGGDVHLGPAALVRGLADWVPRHPLPALTAEEAPRATVIVPTAGRADKLEHCLDSLRALRYPSFDVLVVDNRPQDPATRQVIEALARQDARVGYTSEPRPGLSVARNHGIARTASSEIVAFTDDDVVVDPDWLGALMRPFMRDRYVVAVTGLVLPSELETHAQWSFERYRGFGRGLEPRLFDLDGHRSHDRPLYPYWGGIFGSGNSMAFRRAELCAIGGFDTALGAGSIARAGEDVEALSQLVLSGGRIAYEPHAVCWHTHRSDERALRRQMFSYGIALTAILTKWSLRHPSLFLSILRTIPLVLSGAPSTQPGQGPGLPSHLRRLEIMGYAVGPLYYMRSVRRARRLRLADAAPDSADRDR